MFKRSPAIPERKRFCLSSQEIIEDIESVYKDEEQRNRLFYCLDQKPPQEHEFNKIKDFLEGTQDLEHNSQELTTSLREIQQLSEEISEKVTELRIVMKTTLKDQEKS